MAAAILNDRFHHELWCEAQEPRRGTRPGARFRWRRYTTAIAHLRAI